MEIDGIDKYTHCRLCERGARMELSMKLHILAQRLLTKWALSGIGFLPFCLDCKVPLRWVEGEGDVLFRCPTCMGEWVKDNEWIVEESK